jgi:hypothetical protein
MVGQIGKKSCDLSRWGITKDTGLKSWSGWAFVWSIADVIDLCAVKRDSWRESGFRISTGGPWWATFALRGHSQPADNDSCVIARTMAAAWTAQGRSIKTFNEPRAEAGQ